jgi:PAS domain S-box-containing protein
MPIGGSPVICMVATDLTESRRAEAALRESETRLRQLVSNAPVALWMVDKDGIYTFVEGRGISAIHAMPGPIVGQSIYERMADQPKVIEQLDRAFSGEEAASRIRSGAKVFDIRYSPFRSPDGEILGVIGVSTDVTEQERAEAALQTAYGELELRVQERTAQLAEANKELASLNEELAAANEELAAANEELQYEIVERRRVEEKLQQSMREFARSNAELEQFAYVASHDLQEPLRNIGSFSQLLARRYQGKIDPDADEFIGYIVDGVSRMHLMINDLLAYSRVNTFGKALEWVEGDMVVEAALANLKMVIDENKATVTHDPLPAIVADPSQMVQLFQNLIGNGIKFHRDEQPRVHVSARRAGSEWIFSIEDNGIGIQPEFKDRIFVIFQRLHSKQAYAGTGIGLAICKKIVERHGGRIWVESIPGQGSTFYFTLAIRDVPTGPQPIESPPAPNIELETPSLVHAPGAVASEIQRDVPKADRPQIR